MKRWTSAATILMVAGFATTAAAQSTTYQVAPWTFVGTSTQCGGPAGSKIVTSVWQAGLGLPDNASPNPDGKDPHNGLLLSKNGPTPNCSAPGADIVGWNSGDTLDTLGFDYRNGGHCGAGAPRFNVKDMSDVNHFFGCAGGAHSASVQDPGQWENVVFSTSDASFVFGVTPVKSIEIVYDEGTDSDSPDDPNGVGLAVLDNIRINNTVIRNKKPVPIAPR